MKVSRNLIYPVGTEGFVSSRKFVTLSWVEEHEYDLVTTLRNQPHVGKWFLDNRLFDKEQNKIWLSQKMKKPQESLLSIRFKDTGLFLGTIGWSDWDLAKKTAYFGRVAIDYKAIRKVIHLVSKTYEGFAVDAGIALRDYAFMAMHLEKIKTYYLSKNTTAARLNQMIGLTYVSKEIMKRCDGSLVEITHLELTRSDWESSYL